MIYFGTIVTILIAIGLYGFLVSLPIRMKQETIDLPFDLSICQISDMHVTNQWNETAFNHVINEVNDTTCDLLIFTGDLFQTDDISDTLEASVTTVLSQFDGTFKYAVLGNHDYYSIDKTIVTTRVLQAAGFTILKNENISLDINGTTINLIGLDDLMMGDAQYDDVLSTSADYDHNIVLAHEPDSFDEVRKYDVDVMFSGHSHGGQVRLPYIGSIINVPGAKQYPEHHYYEDGTHL